MTRRTGEQAGESERRRKRDRILEWMGSSGPTKSNSGSGGGSNLVQPLLEDGTVLEEDPPVQKVKFEKLFTGMPTLDEILSRDSSTAQDEETSSSPKASTKRQSPKLDGSWFEEEEQQIRQEYEDIIVEVKAQIEQQRQDDPESMPKNSEGVAESVVRQEMDRMIKSVKDTRARERLKQYEDDRISELDSSDLSNIRNQVVDNIWQEASKELKRKEALQAEVDDYQRYESQAKIQSLNEPSVPVPGDNLDTWALERLEKMLEATEARASEEGAAVTDILEQQIDDLRERIGKESKKGSIKPQTMKEWQMYRAIANRLGQEMGFDPKIDAALNLAELDEQQVSQRLDAWRDYIGKEEQIRKEAGLSLGPKMPFDWQSSGRRETARATLEANPTKSRREIRRDVNMQAIQAFEALVEKSDPARAENLRKQLEALRAELEPRDFVDVDEELDQEESLGPVDLSDVFGSREMEDDRGMLPSTLYEEEKDVIDRVLSSDDESIWNSESDFGTPVAPPQSPFFSENFEQSTMDANRPPPPKTPFFTDTSSDYEASTERIDAQNSKLGSADEQKLLNMYRRAGARTKEEQDTIRKEWEQFQALERAKRGASGLSDEDNDASLIDLSDIKYDISDVMKDDGDFDADKILSTIGPRPKRRKMVSNTEAGADAVPKSALDPAQVSESLFRSVSAVGGGRVKDEPEIRDSQKAEFEEYMRMEEAMRQSLDHIDDEAKSLAVESGIALDDPSYAQDVLASIGPRPSFKQKTKQTMDEQKLSDGGGVGLYDDDDDDGEEEEADDTSSDYFESSASIGLVPDWLQKERVSKKKEGQYGDSSLDGLSGGEIDEMFDDDVYDRNLRQLHEYEQRRSGKDKQMGIDISDVLGNRARGTDDYADYSYDANYFRDRQDSWGKTSFEARKALLLEYVELSTPELNNLMDHRDSVFSSGVSQYLPRVNKPFKEFGAIFRLEGVLLDVSGLHKEAWAKVAAENGYKIPSKEEIQQAAVTRPESAIREVFYWTNDSVGVRQAIDSFYREFSSVFQEWADTNGLVAQTVPSSPEGASMALGAELVANSDDNSSLRLESEQSRLKRFQEAWTTTAMELELPHPTNEQIAQSTFLAPEIAVRNVFRWTSDQNDITSVVAVFNAMLNDDVDKSKFEVHTGGDVARRQSANASILESQYQAWLKIAESGSFNPPTPEEVLAASVLNDPEAVIMDFFGWTSSAFEAKQLADDYRGHLSMSLPSHVQANPTPSPSVENTKNTPTSSGPTDEEILEMQLQAWGVVATEYAFIPPKSEQVQLTMNMSAGDAVRRLLGWTYNFNEDQIDEISATYSQALREASEKYLKDHIMEVSPVDRTPKTPMSPSSATKEISQDELYKAAFDAWTAVAWNSGYSLPDQLPDQEKVQFAMAVGPEEAIVVGFKWTDDYAKASEIANLYRDQLQQKRAEWIQKGYNLSSKADSKSEDDDQPLVVVRADVKEWIESLKEVEMGCGVTSYLKEDQVDILLRYAGLADLLPPENRVSRSNGYDRDSQQMLGAALRIERRPDHCVTFDSSPATSAAAHEVDMRSVAIVGPYPRYELLSADTSASSFDELTAMNIRRLFGERVYDQPMLDRLQTQPEVRRKTKTAFWNPDD